ncbi:galactose/methyl galactoside import ATP-binding protein MglA [Oxobacter pfennigii]|uniref:Galactose/methyl galactoside import ATP-binding protein MglA n=1 Tax=Oxobacter pfennigii TaxID=36849 RepID=A0A0P8WRN7_9CLOT|nr:ABC transporter ATP-binding protein [Oxobacter pfennigii]KPU45265.1 galactose/methyl galactoside import ATP-binding protein MglA [Oxobacter pfennigii]
MGAVVEMKGITKIFPGTVANDSVDFTLEEGEIHVLLGENGAGKTTLMNILYGLTKADKGEIYIKGSSVKITNPNIAISKGIGMVHQHFMLVEPFTVTENIVLGSEPKSGLRFDNKKARENVLEISRQFGLDVDPDAKIQDISVGMQQRVEILKSLYRGADILILDEPTAVLTPQEIEELGEIFKQLVNQGKSIILITHKLKEVMSMSSRVTILRRGKVVGTVKTKDADMETLAEMMVGRKVSLKPEKTRGKIGQTVLEIKGLKAVNNRKMEALKGIDLEVKKGEILGIAGVDGNGQTELVEAITGLIKPTEGRITINGRDITGNSPRKVIEAGVAHIPEDRHKRGLVLKFSLAENMILGSHYLKAYKKGMMMDYTNINSHAKKLIEEFDVRTPDEKVQASSLSGGNQQKVVVAREVDREPELLIASQPTRGLDVGAIEYIHKRLIEERDKGKAVLLVSLELDEIMELSDRIAVMYGGRISGIVDAGDADETMLGVMMAGGEQRGESNG